MTGRITSWVEVGMPDAQRLHRGSKIAGRCAVYTHRSIAQVLGELSGRHVHRAAEIPVYEFGRGFVEEVATALQRRSDITLSVIDRQLYLDVGGQAFGAALVQHHFT